MNDTSLSRIIANLAEARSGLAYAAAFEPAVAPGGGSPAHIAILGADAAAIGAALAFRPVPITLIAADDDEAEQARRSLSSAPQTTVTTDANTLRRADLIIIAATDTVAGVANLSAPTVHLSPLAPTAAHTCLWLSGPGLCEITGDQKAKSTQTIASLAHAAGLRAILTPGPQSVSQQLTARYHEAADTVLLDGSTPWEIDEAMVDLGFETGPYEARDNAGLDPDDMERRRRRRESEPSRRYIPIVDRMWELGKLGRATGAGWYRYPGGGGKVDDPIVADLALEEAHFADVARTDYGPAEIQRRLILAIMNEAAGLITDATSAGDIDLIARAVLGFPCNLGGPLRLIDEVGAERVAAELRDLMDEDAIAWRISPRLAESARSGAPLTK